MAQMQLFFSISASINKLFRLFSKQACVPVAACLGAGCASIEQGKFTPFPSILM